MSVPPVKSGSASAYFNRWSLGWGRTWAYRLFKSHHTQLNSLYWSHAPALRYVFSATRGRGRDDPASSLFTLPSQDLTRINISLGDWAKHYGDFDNWVRLNALVAITGYLEVYLKTVTRLALESDPSTMVAVELKHSIDGMAALKRKSGYNFAEIVIPCVRGSWPERLGQYRRFFGVVPNLLDSSLGALEGLRRIRNGVTHSFGRATDEYDSLFDTKPRPFQKVSEDRLKKTLALVDKLALAVDDHLGSEHIGDYEALYFYHRWDKNYPRNNQTEARALAKQIGLLHVRTKDIRYYQELIDYYNVL